MQCCAVSRYGISLPAVLLISCPLHSQMPEMVMRPTERIWSRQGSPSEQTTLTLQVPRFAAASSSGSPKKR